MSRSGDGPAVSAPVIDEKDISASLNDVLLEGIYAAIMEQLVPRSQALSESLKGLQATCSSVDRAAAEDLHATETEMRRLAGLVEQCRKELDDVLSKK
ncbi:hypothetical protein ACKKBG_A20550 [Auxenochlorella protothecoides x Auxenochlorella symbiontica]